MADGSSEEHSYTDHLPDGSAIKELVGSIQMPAKYSWYLQISSAIDEFPYRLPTSAVNFT